jgi:transcriptional regulator with XRE-family HTH domain
MAMKKNSSDERVEMGARLRTARELAGLSQEQVAKMLSMRRPSISEIEAGQRKVSSEELRKFSEVYDVKLAWLIGSDSEDEAADEKKIRLAARELSKLKPEDLTRVIALLRVLRRNEGEKQ